MCMCMFIVGVYMHICIINIICRRRYVDLKHMPKHEQTYTYTYLYVHISIYIYIYIYIYMYTYIYVYLHEHAQSLLTYAYVQQSPYSHITCVPATRKAKLTLV